MPQESGWEKEFPLIPTRAKHHKHFLDRDQSLLILKECKDYASVCAVETDTHQVFLSIRPEWQQKPFPVNPTRAPLFLGFSNKNFLLQQLNTCPTSEFRKIVQELVQYRFLKPMCQLVSPLINISPKNLPQAQYNQTHRIVFNMFKEERDLGFIKKITYRI